MLAKRPGATLKQVLSGFGALAMFVVMENLIGVALVLLWKWTYRPENGTKLTREVVLGSIPFLMLLALLPAIKATNYLYPRVSKLFERSSHVAQQ